MVRGNIYDTAEAGTAIIDPSFVPGTNDIPAVANRKFQGLEGVDAVDFQGLEEGLQSREEGGEEVCSA